MVESEKRCGAGGVRLRSGEQVFGDSDFVASRMLKDSSIGAHHGQVCTGDLSQAGRFGKVA
jgi:hypothetical protein